MALPITLKDGWIELGFAESSGDITSIDSDVNYFGVVVAVSATTTFTIGDIVTYPQGKSQKYAYDDAITFVLEESLISFVINPM